MPNDSGNRGEWAEIYAFIKLLNDRKIHAADESLQPIEKIYFPIIKIQREEHKGKIIDYVTGDQVEIKINDKILKKIPLKDFESNADFLYDKIFSQKKGNILLDNMPSFKSFLDTILVEKIKAASNEKIDIKMEIIDIYTSYQRMAGFSIKSQIGSPSSLMNASKATNITYKILGIDDDIMNEVNSINSSTKIIDRFSRLYSKASSIEYHNIPNKTFKNNLELLDSKMPEIIAHAMVYRYRDNIKYYKDIVEKLVDNNPMQYGNPEIYQYKFKKLLAASALGMLPATKWSGLDAADGGYIIVKSNGDVVAYYIYNRDAFETYLLNNTYLETGGTTRHEYAQIFKDNNEYFVNMNIQIRFKA